MRTGGRMPYDKANAAVGPARVLWAETSVALPANTADIISMVADEDGEYLAQTGWTDFGLAADAPSYTHEKETEGLEYQQPTGVLFEQVSSITRSFTAQVAEIDPENLKIIENSSIEEAVAATAAAAPKPHPGFTKVHMGLYSGLKQYRIALISYRPEGAGVVTEPAPSSRTRPPSVALILPLVALAAEGTDIEFDAGTPVNAEVAFTILPDSAAGAGKEHGYWSLETAGAILA